MKLKMLTAMLFSSILAVSLSYADPVGQSTDEVNAAPDNMQAQMDTNTNNLQGNNDQLNMGAMTSNTTPENPNSNNADEAGISPDTATGDDDY